MNKLFRNKPTYANVTSTLALILALGMGSAYAADQLIGTGDIEKNAITSKLIDNDQVKSKDLKDNKAVKGVDVADGSLAGIDVLDASLALADLGADSVDSTKVTDGSLAAGDLVAEEDFHLVGAAGEPALNNGGQDDCRWTDIASAIPGAVSGVGFRKDRFGIVHLTGAASNSDGPGGDAMCGGADSFRDGVIFTLPAAYVPAKTIIAPGAVVGDVGSGARPDGLLIAGAGGLTLGPDSLNPGDVFMVVSADAATDAAVFTGINYPSAESGVAVRGPAGAAAIGETDIEQSVLGD